MYQIIKAQSGFMLPERMPPMNAHQAIKCIRDIYAMSRLMRKIGLPSLTFYMVKL